eukprot:m51a1_g12699 hypothetical protein (96) ;mRNA; f:3474-3761
MTESLEDVDLAASVDYGARSEDAASSSVCSSALGGGAGGRRAAIARVLQLQQSVIDFEDRVAAVERETERLQRENGVLSSYVAELRRKLQQPPSN